VYTYKQIYNLHTHTHTYTHTYTHTHIYIYIYIYIYPIHIHIYPTYIYINTHVVASKCSGKHFISEKYKIVQSFKLYCFKIVFLCNYTLLPATAKTLETILEAIL
jgi:hypothetical protein